MHTAWVFWLKKRLLQQLAHKRFLEHLHKTRHIRHFKAFSALNLPEQGGFWGCFGQLSKISRKSFRDNDSRRYVALRYSKSYLYANSGQKCPKC